MAARLIYSTWPDEPSAAACAQALIERRLAACVTLLPTARSFYRWEDSIQDSSEVVMLAKTDLVRAEPARDAILARHPHDLPCVLAVEIDGAASNLEFLQWIATETT
jgi:periplasmic divalent cation tolerance protein